MKLSLDYLEARHKFWLYRIADCGIWNPLMFNPVELKIRKHHRRYNGLFQRRITLKNGERQISDKIVIYNNTEEIDPLFLDNVLVHEMIHQYIIQNEIKDTSTHGRIFKSFMLRINNNFPNELNIKIKDENPSIPKKGEGPDIHKLLIINFGDSTSMCAVIHHSKTAYFERLLVRNKIAWGMTSFIWAESKDIYFSRFTRCSTRLHGIKIPQAKLSAFLTEYNIIKSSAPPDTKSAESKRNTDKGSTAKKKWWFLRRN